MDPVVYDRANRQGWIEVVCGSMFSGKTEELIRRLRRARIARQRVEIFKPAVDNRFSEEAVVSHDENALQSTAVEAADQIVLLSGSADVVGVDEAQFFGLELVAVCEQLARDGKRVIVAGLDQDFAGRPFEPMPQLMAVAEFITKLHAICMVCGAPANHSQRLSKNTTRVLVGATDSYEPRCRRCFVPPREAAHRMDSAEQRPAPRKAEREEAERDETEHDEAPPETPDVATPEIASRTRTETA